MFKETLLNRASHPRRVAYLTHELCLSFTNDDVFGNDPSDLPP